MFGVDVAKQYLVPKGEYCWKYVEALRFIAFYIAYLVVLVRFVEYILRMFC